jgi:hypothetical protein
MPQSYNSHAHRLRGSFCTGPCAARLHTSGPLKVAEQNRTGASVVKTLRCNISLTQQNWHTNMCQQVSHHGEAHPSLTPMPLYLSTCRITSLQMTSCLCIGSFHQHLSVNTLSVNCNIGQTSTRGLIHSATPTFSHHASDTNLQAWLNLATN